MAELRCDSRIEAVVVHARGAEVRRRVVLPDAVPEGRFDLVVGGVTVLAATGAISATAGGRAVLAVSSRAHVPDRSPGPLPAELTAARRERDRLHAAVEHLRSRRADLLGLTPEPRGAAADRVAVALRAATALDDLTAGVERDLAEAEVRATEAERTLLEVQRRASEASAAAQGSDRPTIEVVVALDAGEPLTDLALTYTVPAARWWPALTARVEPADGTAELALSAFVAQRTLEDWTGVRISVSTADLLTDARLPELPALRLGRRVPPKPTGYRDPPEGLDTLFAGFDEARPDEPVMSGARYEPDADVLSPVMSEVAAMAPPPAPMAAAAAPKPQAAPKRSSAVAPGAGRAQREEAGAADAYGGAAYDAAPAVPEPLSSEVEPEGGWLDFDALELGDPEAYGDRGRLLRRPGLAGFAGAQAEATLEGLPAPGGAPDPQWARGQFDHRWDATGVVDVPGDGRPHRVPVVAASAPCALVLRTVPVSDPTVYREASVTNPFGAPLLGGPVEVFVAGELAAASSSGPVDTGGALHFGLGAEDRVRVARNVRVDESAKGMLSSSTVVEHEVEIEVASSLGVPVDVEVVDRLPVSDDKDIEVELVRSEPKAERYDQAALGSPVRGGIRWRVPVEAGETVTITCTYRISFPAKDELVGGNRRG